ACGVRSARYFIHRSGRWGIGPLERAAEASRAVCRPNANPRTWFRASSRKLAALEDRTVRHSLRRSRAPAAIATGKPEMAVIGECERDGCGGAVIVGDGVAGGAALGRDASDSSRT